MPRLTSLVTVSLAESETVLLTQQAPVRRGPRASATSLVTVLMASVLPNLRYYLRSRAPVRRGPRDVGDLSFHSFAGTESETVLLTQQAPVRRGPRASATSLVTVSLAESEADAFLPNGVCVSPVHTRRVPET